MQALKETATSSYNQIVSAVSNMTLPKTYKAAQFEEKGGPLVFKEFDLTPPKAGEVRLLIEIPDIEAYGLTMFMG